MTMRKSNQHCGAEPEKDARLGSQASIDAKFRSIRRSARQMNWMLLATWFMLMLLLMV